ncbi:MAG TPA: U32 family peptidase [Syntrophomonadaceae bacterium]|nr:U32 family peptidase [Syntrophomonadaceae bacterium]HQA06527.1 U32 family peptidase [Syntrophomonadaceae bacterium]HQE22492.1 U32 family peptidase [Syntrophomonadaceae bacterium]
MIDTSIQVNKLPELVLPAGDLEKLYTAVIFGADAVYAGGYQYSLRAYAGNLSLQELQTGVDYARQLGKRVYITVNILAHNEDLKDLPAYLEKLEEIGVDGMIISDLGIIRLARRYAPTIPITISTQANVTNYEAAAFYRDLGARRIVAARELSLDEIIIIKERTGLEIEMFIHGAMCMSYSGRCLLSSFMTGRSANRGECAHPCRYKYTLMEEKRPGEYFPIHEDQRGSYILNSRDLCLLEQLPRLVEAGIDAFKIEGRMKSPLYLAVVTRVYREALDHYRNGTFSEPAQLEYWLSQLQAVATRPFTRGFIDGRNADLQDPENNKNQDRAEFCGMVQGYDEKRCWIEVEQRANFGPGDPLWLLTPQAGVISLQLEHLYDSEGQEIDRARHACQHVYIPFNQPVANYSILYRLRQDNHE